MTQTIRRKNCKTRREWADNKVSDAQRRNPKFSLVEIAGLVAEAEYARAVRVVRQAKALQLHGLRDTDTNEFLEGYAAACVDILSALMKGRA